MGVDCECCGVETGDPQACADCGGVFCPDHELPFTHECPSLEGVVDEETFRADAEPGAPRSMRREATAWVAVVAATLLSLALVGVATGVFTPAAFVDTQSGPADTPDPVPVSDPEPPDPDAGAIRTELLSRTNEWRTRAGYGTLDRAPERRTVLDRIARDLAADDYFDDPGVRDEPQFSPRHRLGENGLGCTDATHGFVVLTPGDDRRSAGAFARDAVEMLRPELADEPSYRRATLHDVGVHVTSEGVVYVAYVAC